MQTCLRLTVLSAMALSGDALTFRQRSGRPSRGYNAFDSHLKPVCARMMYSHIA